jgi:uncharacterized protein
MHVQRITRLLKRFSVVALLGARQVGKTTLAGLIAPALSDHNTRFDLENPADVARLADPMLALQGLKGIVLLDEVQRRPELFPVLRVLADRLWMRGGFPKAFLARSDRESLEWRQAFIRTFLERGLPALGVNIASDTMRRFWLMLAHYHAQLWAAANIRRVIK